MDIDNPNPQKLHADPKTELASLSVSADRSEPSTIHEYLTGVKLGIIVAAVAFVSFLMLLDTMIISTVSCIQRLASFDE